MSTPPEPPVDPWATPSPPPVRGRGGGPYFDPDGGPPAGGESGQPYGAPASSAGPSYGQYGQYRPAYGVPARSSAGNGMGTAALILGIIAVVLGVFLVGGFFGLIAIVLGIVGRRRYRRGEATNGGSALAGTLLGATGLVIAVGMIVAVFVVFADPIADYRRCLDRAGSDVAAQQTCNDQLRQRFEDRLRP